ncbi:MAG TPA: hypothetical protein VGN96_16985 [Roseococcus sp.]|jgi:hypothetical protein|nr:hypothetical protein [Roseococcus sp.]
MLSQLDKVQVTIERKEMPDLLALKTLHQRDGRFFVFGPTGIETEFMDSSTSPALLDHCRPVPDKVLALAPGLSLLSSGAEPEEAWLLATGTPPEKLAKACENPDPSVRCLARSTLGLRLRDMVVASVTTPPRWEGLGDLPSLDARTIARLALLADPAGDARWAGPEALPGAFARDALAKPPFTVPRNWQRMLRGQPVSFPSLFCEGEAETTQVIPLDLRNQAMTLAWLCLDAGRACLWLGDTVPGRNRSRFGLVWLPDENVLLSGQPLDEAAVLGARRMIAQACAVIAQVPAEVRPLLSSKQAGVALFVPACAMEGPHIGHAIWDEMSPLDRALSEAGPDIPPPPLFRATSAGGSGLDLFGPVDELYPEFAGRITAVNSPAELLTSAVSAGVQLFPVQNRGARQASRRRIQAAVSALASASGLAAEADALVGGRPVIALGLRLMNRRPEDLAAFYRRLTVALVERLGSCVILVDGLNTAEDGKGVAAQIYSADSASRRKLGDGATELDRELGFVSDFAGFAANLPGPVTVVSCVGMGLRANLYWLSRASFFIAPLGAGLAKLRWALDVPGFVPTSRANLEFCPLADIYSNTDSMEPPFTPLYYTEVDEVEDVLPAPPRKPPSTPSRVPWPDNFRFIDEGRLIARICDLAVATVNARN